MQLDELANFILAAMGQSEDDAWLLIEQLSGRDCVRAHNYLKDVDDLLKKRWEQDGAPEPELLR